MLKLAVLQRVINAGETDKENAARALADVWKVARTVGGNYLEYDPVEFSERICHYLRLRLTDHNKAIIPWYKRWTRTPKIKRIDEIYTADEVVDAFRKAWNDVTREIKRKTIKVL